MINRILTKIFRKQKTVIKPTSIPHDFEYLAKAESSILLPQTRMDFRLEKEDRKYVTIGENCLIGSTFTFESQTGKVVIGTNVHIGGAHFICKTKIEVKDDVTMAWGITLYDHDSHSINWEYRKNDNHQCYEDYLKYQGNNIVNKDWSNVISKPIIIESKAWIGFDVTILKGVTIGEGAVVGAKSVVTKDVEPWTVVAGNPAVVVKYLPEYKQ